MLSKQLKGNVQFLHSVSSWEEAIKESATPLSKGGNITEKYVDDMIQNVHENGPYIVIVPGIAMPHAQNNDNSVVKTGVSLLKLEEPVAFPEGKEVNLLFTLAAEDTTGHLDLISDLSSLLIEDDVQEKLEQSNSEKEILELIQAVE
ncbi:PTS sugar transporter subunit IIA [Guptibacillus hwajinpoensis]|uniref:Ascorbate-specific PTS system EIIA component n=1 Tax=Guptibacillus hwajinpoensis TaxID=208199 RepID=A0ABU0K3U9_9BACL|nr:PTS sugar transporter subunit IIA [Alkalihalobacillus hemicentroti]MDQ0484024.1 PTS system mannitol-specific IIA component/PTS system ascorbate-specific IIA component [Alkalihalobacillus hemicentroti]